VITVREMENQSPSGIADRASPHIREPRKWGNGDGSSSTTWMKS